MDEALQYELDKLPEQAQEHIEKAINHLTNAERKYKETIMNNVPFKTIDYVFGQDIKGMTEDQLLDAIRTVEKEIESYASIKSKSTKVDKRKEELNAALVRIVEALDTK
jgi:predicted RNA-binding protein with PIN domain